MHSDYKTRLTALSDKLTDVVLEEADPDACGIVYCSTRKNVEDVCERLRQGGFSATRYHAGLTDEERRRNQDDFKFDRARIMVATNAFGMGIDKPDVRLVLHADCPNSLEAYFQEAGRAGRDDDAGGPGPAVHGGPPGHHRGAGGAGRGDGGAAGAGAHAGAGRAH